MSLVIYNQPRLLDFAGNNLFLQLKGTDYAEQIGVKAFLYFTDARNFEDEDVLELTFMGRTHRFILWEANPPFPTDPYVETGFDARIYFNNSTQLTDMCNALASYAPLALYYDVVTDGSTIFVTAKEFGPDYNIGTPLNESNIVDVSNYKNGIEQILRENYHVLATLFVENLSAKGTFKPLPEFRLDPTDKQLVTLDMGKVIRRRFLDFFDLPNFSASQATKTNYTFIRYYFAAKEMSGTTQLAAFATQQYKALNGRVSKSQHPGFDVREWIVSAKKFLTNMPSGVVTHHGSKAILYFLNPYAGTGNYIVRLSVSRNTGADIQYSQSMTLAQYDTVMIPVDGIVASIVPEITEVLEVSVWVETSATVMVSGKQTYYYRPKPLFASSMLFQNQFGVFDAFDTYTHKSDVKSEAEQATATLTPNYSSYVGNVAMPHPSVSEIITAETGPISHAMASHLKELFASRVVFWADTDRYIRVVIEKGSAVIVDQDKETANVQFKFRPAFDGDFMTIDIDLPTAPHKDYSEEYLNSDYQ